jgi:hypothetical protein
MTNIPTAEEFMNDIENIAYSQEEMMIVFAKLHVEAALQAASKNSQIILAKDWIRKEETILPRQLIAPITIKVEQSSILDAYSFDNIK